jgi:hypothetical protein
MSVVVAVAVLCFSPSSSLCSSSRQLAVPSYEKLQTTRADTVLFFDDMESGTNGWTSVDNTSVMSTKFHLDTYLAYEGTYSWWCGEINPNFTGGSGYGNSWDQRLEIPPTDLAGATYPILTYAYRHDSEIDYDFTYVQAESNGVYVNLARGYDGSSGGWHDLDTYGFTLLGYDDPLKARFRFLSDGVWSDEDGLYVSDGGAFHCDNLKVFDYYTGYVYFYDDGESGGLCVPSQVMFSGDWWHIVDRECSAYSGTHSWWCGDDADTSLIPPSLDNSLISPAIDLTGVLTCTVRLAMHIEVPTVDDDYVAFSASNDSGANWTQLAAYWGDFGECSGWGGTLLNQGFDLGANGLLPAMDILFRVTMHTTDNGCGPGAGGGAGVMIDDVVFLSANPPASPEVWHVPSEAPTIGAALDSASAGETVLVAAGTYSPSTRGESFPIVMKSGVRLISEYGAASTIIDAEGTARVLNCVDSALDTHIEGFTLTGGASADGGGVYCSNASPEFRGCLLVDNSATAGGGLYCDSGSGPTLTNCTLVENEADDGSGVCSAGGSDVYMVDCLIVHGGPGAAFHCTDGGIAELIHCDVYGNAGGDWVDCIESQWLGGNMSRPPGFCDREAGDYWLCSRSPCLRAPGEHIGAFEEGCESVTWAVPAAAPTIQAAIDSARNYDTISVDCGTYYEHDLVLKPGVSLESASGEADCVTIDAGGSGRVLYCYDTGWDASLTGITFTGGSADYGGGVRFANGSPEVTNCIFAGNEASVSGGAALCEGWSYPVFRNCTFYSNSAPDATICLADGSQPTLIASIVAFGTAGSAVSCGDTSDIQVACTDIYGNAGGDWTGCIAPYAGGSNLSEDPLFADAPGGDLRLTWGSPCLGGPCDMLGALGPVTTVEPMIAGVADVPDDQGGFVTVSWARSAHETDPYPPTIVNYELYRRQAARVEGWDLVHTMPADGSWIYEKTVASLCDSTAQQGACWSTFFVRATTPFPASYFDSAPDSCYSVDNLAPNRPHHLHAVQGSLQVALSWDASDEPDFDKYAVYRDTVPGFEPDTPLDFAPTEGYVDTELPDTDAWWYVVTSFDINGNESEPSDEVPIVDDPPGVPQGVHAYGDTTLVNLLWRPNGESDFYRYAVYRDTVRDVATATPLGYAFTEQFEDPDPPDTPVWWYVVTAWDYGGKESDPSLPDSASTVTGAQDGEFRLALRHASPNPFNPMTVITYVLPEDAPAELSIYDASGKLVRALVRERDVSAGVHHEAWNGRDDEGRQLPSGVYFYRLEVGGEVLTKRMVLLK